MISSPSSIISFVVTALDESEKCTVEISVYRVYQEISTLLSSMMDTFADIGVAIIDVALRSRMASENIQIINKRNNISFSKAK